MRNFHKNIYPFEECRHCVINFIRTIIYSLICYQLIHYKISYEYKPLNDWVKTDIEMNNINILNCQLIYLLLHVLKLDKFCNNAIKRNSFHASNAFVFELMLLFFNKKMFLCYRNSRSRRLSK